MSFDDATYEDAVELVLKDQRPSASYLQRKLRISWPLADEWLGFMEREGICTPKNASGLRRMPASVLADGAITIPLSKGHVAIIDIVDAHLAEFKWHAIEAECGHVYAYRKAPQAGGKQKNVILHREIVGSACDGLVVDHIDGNGLNNRRNNLRIVTNQVNAQNVATAFKNSSSGVLGVRWHTRRNNWHASIKIDGRHIHLGCFQSRDEAEAARLAAEVKYWGIQPRRAAAHAAVAAQGNPK